MDDLSRLRLESSSSVPLYKQLAEGIASSIDHGLIQAGERLPATRELAGRLGLNRTTVSAAYSLLEEAGLIAGHVGRGSFVIAHAEREARAKADWDSILAPIEAPLSTAGQRAMISFANSRPAREAFPLTEFRRLAKEVIDSAEAADILQLGSPHGYPPLRQYLLAQAAARGIARPGDDLLITNGCQQALDLLARLFVSRVESVALEDPVYHGLLRVFLRAGAKLIPVPIDAGGIDMRALEEAVEQQTPRLLLVTPSFQNPTGTTLSLERRKRIVNLAQRLGTVIIESDIYHELRYQGEPLPALKALDESGNTILLGSYSKVSFPGLRVGWIIGPRPVIARVADLKQITDLHSDQLSQAVLLRFAQSGELARHVERTREVGAQRLETALRACGRYLPAGATYSRPQGGMNLWIELPAPLTSELVLRGAEERGVTFLQGRHFSPGRVRARGFRISFGSLTPGEITRGIQIIGEVAREQLAGSFSQLSFEAVTALV